MPDLSNYLGAMYLSWSAFETALEIIGKQELGVSERQAHIVFGTLGFSSKMDIVVSLILEGGRPNKDELVAAIRSVPQSARRNHITHSLVGHTGDFSQFEFYKRENGNGLIAKKLSFDGPLMKTHFEAMYEAAALVEELSGIHDGERMAYINAAKAVV